MASSIETQAMAFARDLFDFTLKKRRPAIDFTESIKTSKPEDSKFTENIGKNVMLIWIIKNEFFKKQFKQDFILFSANRLAFMSYTATYCFHIFNEKEDDVFRRLIEMSAFLLELVSFCYERNLTEYMDYKCICWTDIFMYKYSDIFFQQGGWPALQCLVLEDACLYDQISQTFNSGAHATVAQIDEIPSVFPNSKKISSGKKKSRKKTRSRNKSLPNTDEVKHVSPDTSRFMKVKKENENPDIVQPAEFPHTEKQNSKRMSRTENLEFNTFPLPTVPLKGSQSSCKSPQVAHSQDAKTTKEKESLETFKGKINDLQQVLQNPRDLGAIPKIRVAVSDNKKSKMSVHAIDNVKPEDGVAHSPNAKTTKDNSQLNIFTRKAKSGDQVEKDPRNLGAVPKRPVTVLDKKSRSLADEIRNVKPDDRKSKTKIPKVISLAEVKDSGKQFERSRPLTENTAEDMLNFMLQFMSTKISSEEPSQEENQNMNDPRIPKTGFKTLPRGATKDNSREHFFASEVENAEQKTKNMPSVDYSNLDFGAISKEQTSQILSRDRSLEHSASGNFSSRKSVSNVSNTKDELAKIEVLEARRSIVQEIATNSLTRQQESLQSTQNPLIKTDQLTSPQKHLRRKIKNNRLKYIAKISNLSVMEAIQNKTQSESEKQDKTKGKVISSFNELSKQFVRLKKYTALFEEEEYSDLEDLMRVPPIDLHIYDTSQFERHGIFRDTL